MKPIRKVLVANRGEIAIRVARACRELGILTVMVYSEADRDALHTSSGNEAVLIGPAPATESYLRGEKLIQVALDTGCDAVHPGYGFLSESAVFARQVVAAGLVWVGPPPDAIELMGSKIASKRLAEESGVPVVPGYYGDKQDAQTLRSAAEHVGYPVLIKASAGGGGKGMRVVESSAHLAEELEGAKREAQAAFGDDAVMLEKYLTRPRHIEVQVLGDNHGNLIHLGERECSVQRRHQKVVEECPSPALDEATRSRITSAALALARAAGYTNAGTVEFIFQEGEFYFLEMNTRVQVEHPVTEEATGFDIVKAQLQIAQGEPLAVRQSDISFKRCAVEARIYAEDPATGFLPSTGRITEWVMPSGVGVRIDSGVERGNEASQYYDPLLCKLIVSGGTRAQALAALSSALGAAQVSGPATNLGFLRWLAANPTFQSGDYSTRLIEEEYDPTSGQLPVPVQVLAAAAIAQLQLPLGMNSSGPSYDVWRSAPWRAGLQEVPLDLVAGGVKYRTTISKVIGDLDCWALEISAPPEQLYSGNVSVNMATGHRTGDAAIQVRVDGTDQYETVRIARSTARDVLSLTYLNSTYTVLPAEPVNTSTLARGAAPVGQNSLQSPMPGKVLRVRVAPGDQVEAGDPVVIIEAMKMEFTVKAPSSGRVSRVCYKEGDQVAVGDVLAEMET
ncbi:MAG TPA: biotin carboxylase N-terminal domain-containing protein [Chloroflexia bacterium]|nr:biotin carboxylase N-terminal domain-containing protein [Chloroflexia bacterium]